MQDKKIRRLKKMHAIKIGNIQKEDLSPSQIALFKYFDKQDIHHETYQHPPIMTVDEGKDLKKDIPGTGGKSLFLTNKSDNYWLVIAKDDTRVDLNGLRKKIGTKRFSFGKAEKMQELLDVTPGSVTPFALLNDSNKALNVILDEHLFKGDYVVFHPLKNDKSTVIKSTDLLKFIDSLGYHYQRFLLDRFEGDDH